MVKNSNNSLLPLGICAFQRKVTYCNSKFKIQNSKFTNPLSDVECGKGFFVVSRQRVIKQS